jgi:hypothetical protein
MPSLNVIDEMKGMNSMTVFDNGRMYFATSYREDEIICLRQARPPNILAAFSMWRNQKVDKDIKFDLIERIGYTPESIIIDCGAYTFRETEDLGLEELIETYEDMIREDGKDFDINNDLDLAMFAHWWFGEFEQEFYEEDKNQYCLFHQYLNFLWWNKSRYHQCFAFDIIGDNKASLLSYRVMAALGLSVIPVYQATNMGDTVEANINDFDILDYYASTSDYIAIGGTAFSKMKGYTKEKRIDIVRGIMNRHPDKKFHLLGTLDPAIVEACPELYSFDGQTWLQKIEKEKKISASIKYLNAKLAWFESKKCGGVSQWGHSC